MSSYRLRRSWLALVTAIFCGAALFIRSAPAAPIHAASGEPFLSPASVVVVSDRLVCSLLGSAKSSAGIVGQDGGGTVKVGGRVYWTFGDTVLMGSGFLPNTLGWSDDNDASDCVTIFPQQDGGSLLPFLPRRSPEILVWPQGMAETAPGQVHVFFDSVVADPVNGWRVAGVGLASFDPPALAARRALGGALLWSETNGLPARNVHVFADDTYLYVFLASPMNPAATGVMLARAPKADVETPSSYEYWQPANGPKLGYWIAGLWDETTGMWKPEINNIRPLWTQTGGHNGVEVSYNNFLGKWLAVYATDGMTAIAARAADSLTGPWTNVDAVLVRCRSFHGVLSILPCYSGSQHPYYARDGGRTIYVTYSNHASYQVLLHEIRLGAPVVEWSDEQGHSVYLVGEASPPAGFTRAGLAFYASDIPAPGLSAIHRWAAPDTRDIRYGASPPATTASYQDAGVAFYAPIDAASATATNALYAPVYRWSKNGVDRYSALNLAPYGYAAVERVFYAACPDGNRDGIADCAQSFPLCPDYNSDGRVSIVDMTFAMQHYRQSKPEGGYFSVSDLSAVATHYRQACPS